MANSNKQDFRIYNKLFEPSSCMDCIFEKINRINKILVISGPLLLLLGVIFVLFGFYLESIFNIVFIVGGITISCLSLVLILFAYILTKENTKLIAKFSEFNRNNSSQIT